AAARRTLAGSVTVICRACAGVSRRVRVWIVRRFRPSALAEARVRTSVVRTEHVAVQATRNRTRPRVADRGRVTARRGRGGGRGGGARVARPAAPGGGPRDRR